MKNLFFPYFDLGRGLSSPSALLFFFLRWAVDVSVTVQTGRFSRFKNLLEIDSSCLTYLNTAILGVFLQSKWSSTGGARHCGLQDSVNWLMMIDSQCNCLWLVLYCVDTFTHKNTYCCSSRGWRLSAKAATPRLARRHNSGTPWIPGLPVEHGMHHWTWHPMDSLWQVCKWYSLEANMLHCHTSYTSYHTDMHKWLGPTHTVDYRNIVAMLRWTVVLTWAFLKMHKHACESPAGLLWEMRMWKGEIHGVWESLETHKLARKEVLNGRKFKHCEELRKRQRVIELDVSSEKPAELSEDIWALKAVCQIRTEGGKHLRYKTSCNNWKRLKAKDESWKETERCQTVGKSRWMKVIIEDTSLEAINQQQLEYGLIRCPVLYVESCIIKKQRTLWYISIVLIKFQSVCLLGSVCSCQRLKL